MLISEYDFNAMKWGEYKPKCLEEILKTQYHRIPNSAYYIRDDLIKILN